MQESSVVFTLKQDLRDYRNYDPLLMNRDIRQSRINEVDKIKNVNDAWNHIKNILLGVFQKHARILNKCVGGKSCPWLTNDLKSKMNTRQATQENEKNQITI